MGKLRISVLNEGDPSVRKLTFTHVSLKKGGVLPAICHKKTWEWFYLLSGSLVATLDGERRLFRPGDYVFLPPGVWHKFEAKTSVSALSIYQPAIKWRLPDVIAEGLTKTVIT